MVTHLTNYGYIVCLFGYQVSSTGTLVIGLIAGASVLAAGPFSGG